MRKELVWITCLGAAACGDGTVPPSVDAPPVGDAATPRALPDLRFKWVADSSSFIVPQISNVAFFQGSGISLVFDAQEFAWTPLQISLSNLIPGSYSWSIASFSPTATIEPFRATAKAGPIAELDAALDGEGVVVSIDLLSDAYAMTTVRPQVSTEYDLTQFEVAIADFPATVAGQAARGFVVTALSAGAPGGVRGFASSRQGDRTIYETEVREVTESTMFENATALATAGYTITAFGRIGDDAGILVGTRAPGAAARAVTLQSEPMLEAGDAVVAWAFGASNLVIVQR